MPSRTTTITKIILLRLTIKFRQGLNRHNKNQKMVELKSRKVSPQQNLLPEVGKDQLVQLQA